MEAEGIEGTWVLPITLRYRVLVKGGGGLILTCPRPCKDELQPVDGLKPSSTSVAVVLHLYSHSPVKGYCWWWK